MLDSIVQEAQAVLARMDSVKSRFESASATVDKLTAALTQARELVATTATNVEDAVNGTLDNIREGLQTCDGKHQDFFDQLTQWTQSLTEAHGKFETSAQATQSAVDKSQTFAEQMLEKIRQTASGFADVGQECVHDFTDHASTLAQRFDAEAQPALSDFDDFLGNLQKDAETFVDDTGATLENLQNNADSLMHDQLITPIGDHVGTALDFLGTLGSDGVDAAITSLMSQGRGLVEDGIKSTIDDLLSSVGSGIDDVMDSIHTSGGENEVMREALRPIFDVIEELMGPIEETMGNVNSIAGAVGYGT
jgi:ABC-type transporter Mla subunit MlaD